MASQSVTVELPEAVYDQFKRAAERTGRPFDQVLAEALAAVAPVLDSAAPGLKSALAHLAYLNDAALWQASRATLAPEQRERLQELHDLQQRGPLGDAERAEEEALRKLYRETLLVRAQAAVLLQQRGYDVTDPDQFAPLG
jgi:protein-disulfide isomerase-like protein with CxxC motif